MQKAGSPQIDATVNDIGRQSPTDQGPTKKNIQGGAKMGKLVFKYGGVGFLFFALINGFLLGFANTPSGAAATPANQIVWRMDFYLPQQDLETVLLQQACNDILEYTQGRLKIDLYPSFSLKLNPGTQLSNIRDGLCEAACMTVQALEGQEASFAVTEAAGVWAGKEDQAKAVDALVPFKKKVYSEVWKSQYVATKMMTVQTNGIFSAKNPIKTLDDLKGFKMRVPSRRQQEPFKALGAAPQTMPPGEVYMALKTGVLDGASSGSRILVYQKWAEVVKYGLEGWVAEANAQDIVVNQKAWDAIPNDIKEIVTMVFQALGQKQRAMAVMPGMSNQWRRQCEALGVQYFQLSAQDHAKLEEVFSNQWYSDLEKANPRTKEAWDIVKQFTMQKK
jgi:TRAP-type transport system periplasmic protein